MIRTVRTKTAGLEYRYKALTHPFRVRAFDAFAEPRGRIATTAEIAAELGLTVDQLSYHVRALERYGWLELVHESRKAGTGVIERFYRAGEVATYDERTWAALSPQERQVTTEHGIALIVADITAADEAGSLCARTDPHLSRTPLLIDNRAWAEIGNGLLALYDKADEIAGEVINRGAARETGAGDRISARFVTLLFEAPGWSTCAPEQAPAWRPTRAESASATPSRAPAIATRLKGLTHPTRVRAFSVFSDPPGRIASPAEVAEEIGVSLESGSYHVKMLLEAGWIELVDQRRKRGVTERRYRGAHARFAPLYDYEDWAALSPLQRVSVARDVAGLIIADVTAAAAAETLDSRLDRHLHRAPLVLDERGFTELERRLTELAQDTERIAAESARRVASGATPADGAVSARLALLLFEAAPRKKAH
jgi:DNA-binding transcriptional ArsR family regulator